MAGFVDHFDRQVCRSQRTISIAWKGLSSKSQVEAKLKELAEEERIDSKSGVA